MNFFSSLEDFNTALEKDVEFLLKFAENYEIDRNNTFNKAAILFLCSKFENFVESLIEEYLFNINELKLVPSTIPHDLKLNCSNYLISKHKSSPVNKDTFEIIGKMWNGNEPIDNIIIESKFNFGKRGEKELRNLFHKIGITDIFQIDIYEKELENYGLNEIKNKIDFKGVYNTVTNMRNNIIHQDASPSLTNLDVKNFTKYFKFFAEKISELLQNKLEEFKKNNNVII